MPWLKGFYIKGSIYLSVKILGENESAYVLLEVHEGIVGQHLRARALEKKGFRNRLLVADHGLRSKGIHR